VKTDILIFSPSFRRLSGSTTISR